MSFFYTILMCGEVVGAGNLKHLLTGRKDPLEFRGYELKWDGEALVL